MSKYKIDLSVYMGVRMNTFFKVIQREHIIKGSWIVLYGVAAYTDDMCSGEAFYSVPDICDDYEKICAFVDLCNEMKLSVLHLEDAIDDFLNTLK